MFSFVSFIYHGSFSFVQRFCILKQLKLTVEEEREETVFVSNGEKDSNPFVKSCQINSDHTELIKHQTSGA